MVLRTNANKEHQQQTSPSPHSSFRRRRSKETAIGFHGGNTESFSERVDTSHAIVDNPGTSGKHQSHHSSSDVPMPSEHSRPCPAARLVLLTVQNAVRMGARTQLNMCPPGRARREMQAILRQRSRQTPHANRARITSGDVSGGPFSLEKLLGADIYSRYDLQEEEFLVNVSALDADNEEDASSGDDEDLIDVDELFSDKSKSLTDYEKSPLSHEPLYAPFGTAASRGLAQSGKDNNIGSSKLPFNRRKIRYFDAVNAPDKVSARAYLQNELARAKKQANLILVRNIQRQQREERKRLRLGKGEVTDEGSDEEFESSSERILLDQGVTQLEKPMSPSFAAALVLESLEINKAESLEGMAKCYDGIVNAGMALLEAHAGGAPGKSESKHGSRADVLSALTPLLITSLEQPSGEAILMLAKLRRMCGTYRYQRRFVQRVAPLLIRPPQGASWCLRHQNDMEPILAAAELILDSAFDIFSKGWYDRGQLILADSKRAETLDSAAKQLRTLSHDPADSGFKLGFTNGSHGKWLTTVKKRKEVGGSSIEPLNEREVVAIVHQIKLSISNVMATDWSRLTVHSDSIRPHRRVYQSRRPSALQSDASPKHTSPSPRSPARGFAYGKPSSPSPGIPTLSDSENVFGPSFSSLPLERATSPPPPPVPAKSMLFGSEISSSSDQDDLSPKQTTIMPSNTLQKSPKSPKRSTEYARSMDAQMAPLSPKRVKSPREGWVGSAVSTPLSPANSVGTSGSGEFVPYRPSAASYALGSSTSVIAANYRTLTSTAAERKRTVAACRALRAQIQRFEDAFFQLHGRPPKGNAERAPLATTYAQYREWKRAIRADAACRIQALLRGARTRSMLLRSSNPMFSKIVANRSGRIGYIGSFDKISLPTDLDNNETGTPSPVATSKFVLPSSSLDQWANPGVVNDRRLFAAQSEPGSPPSAAYSELSLDELQSRKRDLKRQLRQYDMNFARRHGRMPVKAEKEPIRHLYESYNALKAQISQMEQDSRSSQSPSVVARSSISSEALTMASEGGIDESRGVDRSRQNVIRRASKDSPPTPESSQVTKEFAPTQDLNALRTEKSELHQMLRSYERDFFEKHRRQVSSFSDIRPVASQYRRYKEIKRAIAALQQADA